MRKFACVVITMASAVPLGAHAGVTDVIGSKLSSFFDSRVAGFINQSAGTIDQPVARPASTVVRTPAGTNDCDDLNDRLARRLATTVETAAPKESPGQFVDQGFNVSGLLSKTISNGGLSFDAIFDYMRNTFIEKASEAGRKMLSDRVADIVRGAGGSFAGMNTRVAGVLGNVVGNLSNQALTAGNTAVNSAVTGAVNSVSTAAKTTFTAPGAPQPGPGSAY